MPKASHNKAPRLAKTSSLQIKAMVAFVAVLALSFHASPNVLALTQKPKHGIQDQLQTGTLGTLPITQAPTSHLSGKALVDIHQPLSVIRNAHTPKDDNWLEQVPLLKKLLMDARYLLNKFFENLFSAFSKAMPDIKPLVGLSGAASKTLSVIISGLFAFLGLVGLFFILRWWLAYLENKRPARPKKLNKRFDDTLLVNAAHHWQEAEANAKQGNFSDAIRQLYLATLCLFDESKLLPFDESWTNIEYQQALTYKKNVPQDPKPMFSSLARYFEFARYGHYEPSASDYRDASEKYQRLSTITLRFQEQTQADKKAKGGKR